MQIIIVIVENNINESFLPQKTLNVSTTWPPIWLLGEELIKLKSIFERNIRTPESLKLFTINKIYKQPGYPTEDEWTRGNAYKHSKNELLSSHKIVKIWLTQQNGYD